MGHDSSAYRDGRFDTNRVQDLLKAGFNIAHGKVSIIRENAGTKTGFPPYLLAFSCAREFTMLALPLPGKIPLMAMFTS